MHRLKAAIVFVLATGLLLSGWVGAGCGMGHAEASGIMASAGDHDHDGSGPHGDADHCAMPLCCISACFAGIIATAANPPAAVLLPISVAVAEPGWPADAPLPRLERPPAAQPANR